VTGSDAYTYSRKNGVWTRRVSSLTPPTDPPPPPDPDPGTNPRNLLVPGDYKPSASTTGVLPGVTLTPHNTGGGTLTFSTADQTYRDLDIYGDINVTAPGIKFYNCRFRGGTSWPSSADCVVDCRSAGVLARTTTANPWAGVPYFEDCTLAATRPAYFREGFMGHCHIKRCDISNTTDGIGTYNTDTSASSKGARMIAEANWIHDLVYWYPEPAHADGTHNDCIQIQSGGHIRVIGNYLVGRSHLGDDRAYADPDGSTYAGGTLSADGTGKAGLFTQTNGDGVGHCLGAGIIVQRNSWNGAPMHALDTNVVVEKNWFANGTSGANLKDGVYVFRNNWVKRGGFYMFTSNPTSQYPIRPTSATTGAKIVGLYDSNRFEDNGELCTEANLGIRY
jgi:hypothetical protein